MTGIGGRLRWLGAVVALSVPGLAIVEGGDDAPEGQGLAALPPGCSRLVEGYGVAFSRDAKRIAFVKSDDSVGLPTQTWVRDLAAKREWALPHKSRPAGWTADGVLLLELGFGVEPAKGARSSKVTALPATDRATALAWTRDGKRLAYVPDVPLAATTEVRVLGPGAKAKAAALACTAGLRVDQAVFLAWSADGSRLCVNALFQPSAGVPVRRVLVVDPALDEARTAAEMPDWIDIPGLHAGPTRYRDPRAEGPLDEPITWKPPKGPRYGNDVWSATGLLFVRLEGRGWTEADAFVSDAASGETWRVTTDGDAKWSPALDPTDRRLAFLTADSVAPGRQTNRRVRVLDLVTGRPTDLRVPGTDGSVGALSWTPDGKQVAYQILGGERGGTYVQDVAPAEPSPKDAPIRRLEYAQVNRVISWLSSYDAERVHAAVHRAEDAWDAAYVTALREALAKWVSSQEELVPCLIRLLGLQRAAEALPELEAALASKDSSLQAGAARALGRIGAKEAIASLDKVRVSTTVAFTRLCAAVAMIALGDERPWEDLRRAAREPEMEDRFALCAELRKIRDARSVDLLIPLVADRASLRFLAVGDRKTLGAAAQLALESLTGERRGADPAAWTSWWKDVARRTLPPAPPEPAGLRELFGP